MTGLSCKTSRFTLAAAAWLLAAHAEEGEAQAQSVSLAQSEDPIVIYGRRDDIPSFVGSVTRARPGEQIARWSDAICLYIGGISEQRTKYIASYITSIAESIGVRVISSRCQANVFIFMSNSSDAIARNFVRQNPSLYQDTKKYGLPRKADISDFLAPKPVRWVTAHETRVENLLPSRISTPTKESRTFSYILVDSKRVDGASWRQLAAYLSVVALTSPDMTRTYGHETILSVFDLPRGTPTRPKDLTQLDKSLLQAYYNFDPFLSGNLQRADIVAKMARGSGLAGSR